MYGVISSNFTRCLCQSVGSKVLLFVSSVMMWACGLQISVNVKIDINVLSYFWMRFFFGKLLVDRVAFSVSLGCWFSGSLMYMCCLVDF